MSARRQLATKGFTLVEILIVVVILGILAAIVIPQFTRASESANKSSLLSQLQTLRSQLELYQVQHDGTYPTTWDQLTEGTADDGTAGSDWGPYLQQPSENPFVSGEIADSDTIGAGGHWYYDSSTGDVVANLSSLTADKFGELDLDSDDAAQADPFGG